MLLYDYYRSSACYRVRIALNLKSVAHRSEVVSLIDGAQKEPAYRGKNPQGLVPALDTGEGPLLTQSLAIIDWLDARFPEPRLLPADPAARALALAQAMVIGMDIHPIDNLRVLQYLKHQLHVGDDERDDWYRHWIIEGLAALEAMAGEGPYLGGDAPNIADTFLVPQMYNARRFATPLGDFPKLVAIDATAQQHPAFVAAHPDRVKPAE
ncbi:maleylacetoacetate isomerase [Stakelama tenebrarum]|uniref:Maleylacetoacetate isomerase n=1 Tax=Stakelama tenebrarum TaxID=2711215 RepID=A0A6G6Y0H7_9SPHN|nr:maleylacetoacetate isomerase [Sphingosinithalassobacter tenebrarum]QIG78341.1 maleylacetoacetate isomerase [Sphingosinithalassobacter tenebrarum]